MPVGDRERTQVSDKSPVAKPADRAEHKLFEAQQRLKALMDALPVGVNFSDDVTCQQIWGNPAAQAQFEVGPGDNISASAPDGRAAGRQAMFFVEGRQLSDSELPVQRAVAENRLIPPFELEVRLPNGRTWFAEASGAPIHDWEGNVIGGVAVTVDITERKRYADQKLAQKVLERVSGQLIEAQEKERRRISRELHDDISQRLAMLTMELRQASGRPNISREQLMEISDRCAEIALDVQGMSHELHSAKLDYLGIVAALRSFCRGFAEKRSVNIDFTHENVPLELSADISLCLFRVAQEALHNASKHSGKRDFAVHLCGIENHIELEVSDDGAGFDQKSPVVHEGLGLISMRERANFVGGAFSITSSPNRGTKIMVRIPLGRGRTADR